MATEEQRPVSRNENDAVQPRILRLPTEVLSMILEHCVPSMIYMLHDRWEIPRSQDENISAESHYVWMDVQKVCKRFYDISTDVASKQTALYLRLKINKMFPFCEHATCLGGPVQCFEVAYEAPAAVDRNFAHVPVAIFDRFHSFKFAIVRDWWEPVDPLVPKLEALIRYIDPSARARRGLGPLLSLDVNFDVEEERNFYISEAVERFKQVLAPFRRLRNIKIVTLRSETIDYKNEEYVKDVPCDFVTQASQELIDEEIKLLQKAKEEMESSSSTEDTMHG
ncbi:MAG: hypothetical protein M1831_006501 [Alyxoria varia]|nr:MAG: hypothetical protein M1831_006501 [Alyxoria varia]